MHAEKTVLCDVDLHDRLHLVGREAPVGGDNGHGGQETKQIDCVKVLDSRRVSNGGGFRAAGVVGDGDFGGGFGGGVVHGS